MDRAGDAEQVVAFARGLDLGVSGEHLFEQRCAAAEEAGRRCVAGARSLQLRHWVIVDTETESEQRGYEIAPGLLVQTAKAALAVAEGTASAADFSVELSRSEWL